MSVGSPDLAAAERLLDEATVPLPAEVRGNASAGLCLACMALGIV